MSLPRKRFPNRVGGKSIPVPPQPANVRVTSVGLLRVTSDGVTARGYVTA